MSASPSPPLAPCALCWRSPATRADEFEFATGRETFGLCVRCADVYLKHPAAQIGRMSPHGGDVEYGVMVRPRAAPPVAAPVVSYPKMRLERPAGSSRDERIAAIEAAMTRLEIKMSEREARATSRVATS